MWIPQPFPYQLANRRAEAKLSQRELAQLSGINPGRISQFERGTRLPSDEEVQLIAHALGRPSQDIVNFCHPCPREGQKALLERLRRVPQMQPIYPVYKRITALREKYGSRTDLLLKRISLRPDAAYCQSWMGQVPSDSCDELLPWLKLLGEVRETIPRFLSLQQISFDTYAVADLKTGRDLRDVIRPCLELPLPGETVALLFPQVPLRAPAGGYRVDILVELSAPRRRRTCYLEVDGRGHNSTFDGERAEALKLAHFRFTPEEILTAQWVDRFMKMLCGTLRVELPAVHQQV